MTATKQQYRKTEKLLLEIFQRESTTKRHAIDEVLSRFSLTEEQMRESSTNGRKNVLKSRIGEVFAELCKKEILVLGEGGIYSLAKTRPVIIHEEKCEAAILAALKSAPMTKKELNALLSEQFGTDRTATKQDDARLSTAISAVLARLCKLGIILRRGESFSICEKCAAAPSDLVAIAGLREEFLCRLHGKGGEFFEHYFMNLLEKYSVLHSKTVLENTTVGGSDDGGIDGILRTRDCLGFEETLMVQTKNRRITFSEKELRGFYGAVRAKMGSRGLFATTGSLHEGAVQFIDSLPDLAAVNGYMLFKMAVKTLYGIKKLGTKLTVDEKIIG